MFRRVDTPGGVPRALPVMGEMGYLSQGEIAAGLATTQPLAGPRFERQIEHVHSLGARVVSELLAEIAIATGRPDIVVDCVEAYAALDPEVVRFVSADHFPPMPLGLVR